MTDPSPAAAVVRRVLPVPPDVVYEQWLDADSLAEWMCPHPARPTKIELDVRVGGRYLIDIDDEGFELSVSGEYLLLDRPHRLSFTWTCSTWKPSDPDSVVTVDFEPHGDEQTLMTIRHEQLPVDIIDGHESGWARIASQLEDSVRRCLYRPQALNARGDEDRRGQESEDLEPIARTRISKELQARPDDYGEKDTS